MNAEIQQIIEHGMQQYSLQRSPMPPPPQIRTILHSSTSNLHKQSSIVYSVHSPALPHNGSVSDTEQCMSEIQSQDEQIQRIRAQIEELAKFKRLDESSFQDEAQDAGSRPESLEPPACAEPLDDEFFVKKLRFQRKMQKQANKDAKLTSCIAEALGSQFDDLEAAVKALFL